MNRRSAGPFGVTPPAHDPVTPHDVVVSVSFYLRSSDRDRARAAYRHTAGENGVETWSDFVATALLARVEQLESERNAGERFVTSDKPLTPGRRARRSRSEKPRPDDVPSENS